MQCTTNGSCCQSPRAHRVKPRHIRPGDGCGHGCPLAFAALLLWQKLTCAWGTCVPSSPARDTPVLALPWLGWASQQLGVVHHVTARDCCGNAGYFLFICICRIMTENRLMLQKRKQNSPLHFLSFSLKPSSIIPWALSFDFWEDPGIDGTEAAWLILPSPIQTSEESHR